MIRQLYTAIKRRLFGYPLPPVYFRDLDDEEFHRTVINAARTIRRLVERAELPGPVHQELVEVSRKLDKALSGGANE